MYESFVDYAQRNTRYPEIQRRPPPLQDPPQIVRRLQGGSRLTIQLVSGGSP